MTEREIFAEALLRPDNAARAAFLDEICGVTGLLRHRIEQLLELHESEHDLLDRQPAELLAILGDASMSSNPNLERESMTKQLLGFLNPATRPETLGRLGHYEVLHVLGHGGFGIVVKAHDNRLDRLVAIKILAPHLAATSPPRQRFLREARAAASVRHEHVVQIYAVEEHPLPYLVMEFIEGQTLQQRIESTGPLDPKEVVRVGRQIALGLAAAHEKGLIHRDVKPANIILEAGVEPRVKLTDFGLARTADDASMTQSGVIAGSPHYMSPEQVRGALLDHRSDLFSLGSLLYTSATGRPPFRAPSTLAVLRRVDQDTPRPIREVMASVPEGLCAAIMRLLEKNPEDRFQTSKEVADTLDCCLTTPLTFPPPRSDKGSRFYFVVATFFVLSALGLWATSGMFGFSKGTDAKTTGEISNPIPAERSTEFPLGSILVTSILDDDSIGTLRWAVSQANANPGEDTITFDPTVFDTPKTITLTKGPLILTDSAWTTIQGPVSGLTVSGNDKAQVFFIGGQTETRDQPARVWINDLTIAHGKTTDETTVGGGVYCRGGSTLRLNGCTLRDNNALHDNGGGGAIFSDSTLILTNCTFYHNEGFEGGGFKNYSGSATVINCTFVGNSARSGAAIYTCGFNRAKTEVYNSLFADAAGREFQDADALEVTGDYNHCSDDSAPGSHSKFNTPARLGPLGRHGGPTETIPLLPGSPALDAGDKYKVPADIRTDQRGLPRIRNGKVDIGAVEMQ